MSPNPSDNFEQLLRRQGYSVTALRSVYSDPEVIQWRSAFTTVTADDTSSTFYAALGNNRFRKILRAILTSGRTTDELKSICADEQKLASMLAFLQSGGIVTLDGDHWVKGPQCSRINDMGHTLEWYVAEWFRKELGVPARHGVSLKEVSRGGDLDVVALDNGVRVMVECKSGHPDRISEPMVRLFLQRAHDFDPEVAVFFIDSESPVTSVVQLVTNVWGDMSAKQRGTSSRPTTPMEPSGYKGMYWCARNVYVIGAPHSIQRSLLQILRWYHSYVRHQLFIRPTGQWDFIAGTVAHTEDDEPQAAVDGQLWMKY